MPLPAPLVTTKSSIPNSGSTARHTRRRRTGTTAASRTPSSGPDLLCACQCVGSRSTTCGQQHSPAAVLTAHGPAVRHCSRILQRRMRMCFRAARCCRSDWKCWPSDIRNRLSTITTATRFTACVVASFFVCRCCQNVFPRPAKRP